MKALIISAFLILVPVSGTTFSGCGRSKGREPYFPPPDSEGGWRSLTSTDDIMKITGIDRQELDEAFAYVRTTTRNGGLLVVRHGWLVYENYFGLGCRDAAPNLASCGKSFTSVSMGILMDERPELFPEGLGQKVFTGTYLPEMAFPLSDPWMAEIKLGQLLAFTAGIRGNNPVYVNGKASSIDPAGPDGWYANVDEYALGKADWEISGKPFSTKTLWCNPGEGYSYATSSIHIVSIILRHITGTELEEYIRTHLAEPMGWGTWGYGARNQPMLKHTSGGGGIALRSTDMLRFCYMLLHKGKWNSLSLVPESYIELATKASPYNPHYPYSLQFNVNTNGEVPDIPADAYWKAGSGGHCLFVVPSLDLVVWKLGGRDDQYSTSNTGLPQPDRKMDHYGPSLNFTTVQDGSDYTTTLKMVINSIKEP